jgi:hypothetical protein
VERVVIAGVQTPQRVLLREEGGEANAVELQFTHDAASGVLTIKKPDVRVAGGWSIILE